jgi:hypothetical protein
VDTQELVRHASILFVKGGVKVSHSGGVKGDHIDGVLVIGSVEDS